MGAMYHMLDASTCLDEAHGFHVEAIQSGSVSSYPKMPADLLFDLVCCAMAPAGCLGVALQICHACT